MNVQSALWMLMAWCFSTRASVATVLTTQPCVSLCLGVNKYWRSTLWSLLIHVYSSVPVWNRSRWLVSPMMTSSNENIFRLLAICAGNSPVPGEFPTQRPVTWSFDVFFDLRLNKRLSKQSWGWWFEMLSCPLWHHRNACSLPWNHLRGWGFFCQLDHVEQTSVKFQSQYRHFLSETYI